MEKKLKFKKHADLDTRKLLNDLSHSLPKILMPVPAKEIVSGADIHKVQPEKDGIVEDKKYVVTVTNLVEVNHRKQLRTVFLENKINGVEQYRKWVMSLKDTDTEIRRLQEVIRRAMEETRVKTEEAKSQELELAKMGFWTKMWFFRKRQKIRQQYNMVFAAATAAQKSAENAESELQSFTQEFKRLFGVVWQPAYIP